MGNMVGRISCCMGLDGMDRKYDNMANGRRWLRMGTTTNGMVDSVFKVEAKEKSD